MPNHSRRTSHVSRKRKVNRRRTKKGGAIATGDNTNNLFKEIYDDYKSRELLKSKQRLSLAKTLLENQQDAIPLIPTDTLERIGTANRPGLFQGIDNSESFSLLDIKKLLDNISEVVKSSPEISARIASVGFPERERLEKILNEKLEAVENPDGDGKYPLGYIRLYPEEKITNIQEIFNDVRESTMNYVKFDGTFQGSDKDFILLGELDIIKEFIDTFSPEGSSPVESSQAQLFEPIEQNKSKDSCRRRYCSIMGGYKKKYKRKSKKKSNRKSKRGGNGCGKRGGNHCNTKKRGGYHHSKKK